MVSGQYLATRLALSKQLVFFSIAQMSVLLFRVLTTIYKLNQEQIEESRHKTQRNTYRDTQRDRVRETHTHR